MEDGILGRLSSIFGRAGRDKTETILPRRRRRAWKPFEPPSTLDPPRGISGDTPEERRKSEFDNIMSAAEAVYLDDPPVLLDLVRILGRETQSRYAALPLLFPGDVAGSPMSELEELWVPMRQELTPDGARFLDLLEEIPPEQFLEGPPTVKLGKDLVLPGPWSKGRLVTSLSSIGDGRAWGRWRSDDNHLVTLLLPLRVAWVNGGNHSITAGIVQAEGEITPQIVYDMSPVYGHVECDGAEFFRYHDEALIAPVRDAKLAALFEVGRLIVHAAQQNRL